MDSGIFIFILFCHAYLKVIKPTGDEKRIDYPNIVKNPQISGRYEIEETFTYFLFKDGEVVEMKIGRMAGK